MTQDMFNELYKKPIERYAEMVQLLPASESHHHSHLGGMLDHGLEVLSFSAKLRQSYVLPQNAAPEEQSKQRDAWTAAVIYAALVHDIGKVIVDIEIQLKDGSRWFPWLGVPTQPYKFKYIKGRDYDLHPVMGSFLANYLIPKEAFAWLAEYPEAFSSLMYAMADHKDKSGLLSEIVQKADQNSVTLALGGDVSKLTQKPITSFAKQLVMALRHLLQHKFKINTPKGPSDGWLTEDALWLMSKPTADQIRAYLLEQGITAPSDNPKLFSEMQSLGIIESTNDGTAIWHCRIKADSGWCPPKAFSLLRIKPEVAWENLNDRPGTFLGRVNIENEEQLSSSEDIKEENIEVVEEPQKKVNLFERLKQGLTKAKQGITDKIDDVLKSYTKVDEELLEELEEILITADVGVNTTMDIIDKLRDKIKENKITEPAGVKAELKNIIEEILTNENSTLNVEKSPTIILMVGVNGVGKTTTIGKLANRYKQEGKKVLLAAGDTFRAAAIEQLEVWAGRSNVDIIKHQEGADPGAVVFDAIKAAKARKVDLLICDTAGRLHNKANLMNELGKVFKIVDREFPEANKEVLLVVDATTGQNAVVQAKTFKEVADITGIVLTKLDGTAKGGVVLAVKSEVDVPVKLIGVGEKVEDLQDFDAKAFSEALFGSN